MTRPIHLNKREAQTRAEGRLKCLIRPVKRPENYKTAVVKNPYCPGDVVALKETWDWKAIQAEWLTRYPSHPWDSSWCWVITLEEDSSCQN